MRKKIIVFFLIVVFLLSQSSIVFAKGGRSSGGARSSGGSFFSRSSGGYSGSSFSKSSGSFSSKSFGSSKSSGGYTGSSSSKSGSSSSGGSSSTGSGSTKSSSGYTGSSSSRIPSSSGNSPRSTPGSYSAGSSSKSSKTVNTAKNTYMQDQYKKEMSKGNYKTYQQKLNDEQKRVYDSSFSKSYRVNNRMNFEDAMRTRSQRISMYDSRPVRIHYNTYYFGGPIGWGSAFVGPWDLWFLLHASDMFWYHHWNDIYAYRDYFDAAEFAARERTIKDMEARNIARDASYMDPDVDYDLQLSNDYQQKNLDKLYYTDRQPGTGGGTVVTIIVLVLIGAGVVLVIKGVSRSRARPKKPHNSSIY